MVVIGEAKASLFVCSPLSPLYIRHHNMADVDKHFQISDAEKDILYPLRIFAFSKDWNFVFNSNLPRS